METQTLRPSQRASLVTTGTLLAIFAMPFLRVPNVRAEAAAELASFSVFDKIDLAQLSKSEVKTVRGAPMNNARFLSVQTAYVAPRPPARQLAAMRQWSPARHPELKVFLHAEIAGVPGAASFSRLQNAPDNAAVGYLANATAQRSSDLQMSAAEAKQLPAAATGSGAMPATVASFWSKLLAARAQAFVSGGASAQPPYDHTSPAVRPGEELNALLRQQEKMRRQFSGFLEDTGIGRGAGTIKPELYWELLSADEKGVLTLGASYNRAGNGGTYQTANTLYYASGGYYAGLTLHQMWPVDVGGRASTLVWRGDMVSSGSVASLRGIERLAAESSMIKDISKAVSFFRRDTGAAP